MSQQFSNDVYAKPKNGKGIVVRVNADRTEYINDIDKWGNQTADYLVYDEDGKLRLVDGCQGQVTIQIVRRVQ